MKRIIIRLVLRQITLYPASLVLLTIFCLPIATGQITETKLLAGDGAALDYFGYSVSLSGDYALVGASYDNIIGQPDAGSAYIFHYDGSNWIHQTKLIASDGAAGDNFGGAVSLSGDYALVGAYGVDINGRPDAGSAYIFHYDGSNWIQQTKLIARDHQAIDHFGFSVMLSGDYALVGANGDDDVGEGAGSAYIFHYNGSNWIQQTKLIASDGAASDQFGVSVSLSGDYALVGAFFDDDNGADAGSAYVFHFDGSTWVEQTKLTSSDGAASDWFGRSVWLFGDYALIGANGDDDVGASAGSAYIFHYDGLNWVEQTKLTASDGAASDGFGLSVSLSGDYALVGAYGDDDNGTSAGSAYIFHYDGSNWIEQTQLIASDGGAGDNFGQSVSLSGNYALVGALYEDTNGPDAGSAYMYAGFAASEIPCADIDLFKAKCDMGGAARAMVRLLNSTEYAGETVEFQLDSAVYAVELITNGTHTIGRLEVPQAGYGQHTITLVNPAGCYDPITVNCRVDGDVADPGFDAAWAEFDALYGESALTQSVAQETRLIGNYPNPFNPVTTISYELPVAGQVGLVVTDIVGRGVARLVDGYQEAGDKTVSFDASNLASGIYFCRLQAGGFVETRRMLLIK